MTIGKLLMLLLLLLTLIRSGTWPIYSKNKILYNKMINTNNYLTYQVAIFAKYNIYLDKSTHCCTTIEESSTIECFSYNSLNVYQSQYITWLCCQY